MRTVSSVVWGYVTTATGFSKDAVEGIRQTPFLDDVCEVEEVDGTWCTESIVVDMRDRLQRYIEAVRELKAENDKRKGNSFKVKSFVDDTRYATHRQRESTLRVTAKSLAALLTRLDLTKHKLSSLDADEFPNVEELILAQNNATVLGRLPKNVRIVSAASNPIERVENLSDHSQLLFLGLSCCSLQEVDFLMTSPCVEIVDLSYNKLCDIAAVADVLRTHPSLREVTLIGNPLSLLPGYRQFILKRCPKLQVLDDEEITEAERLDVADKAESEIESKVETFTLCVKLDKIVGISSLMPSGAADDSSSPAPAKGATGKGAKAAEKKKKEEGDKPTRRTMICVEGPFAPNNLDGVKALTTGTIDAVGSPPTPQEDPNPKAKGKKVEAQATAAQLNTMLTKHEQRITMVAEPETVRQLMTPIRLRVSIQELDPPAAEGQSTSTTPTPPPAAVVSSVGTFTVSLADVMAPPYSVAYTYNMQIDDVALMEKSHDIQLMNAALANLVKADEEADREEKAAAMDAAAAAAVDQPVDLKPSASTKKNQSSGKLKTQQSTASSSVADWKPSDASQQRKADMEDLKQRIQNEQKAIEKLKGIELQLNFNAELNPVVAMPKAESVARQDSDLSVRASIRKKK